MMPLMQLQDVSENVRLQNVSVDVGRGEIIQEASKDKKEVLTATFDLDELAIARRQWGVFRDRRPSMYGTLLTHG